MADRRRQAAYFTSLSKVYNEVMNDRQFKMVIGLLFFSVVLLSIIWEFYLEDIIGNAFLPYHYAESLQERLEYVISVSLFVAVSLIFPTLFGIKLISRQRELLDDLDRSANEDYLTDLYNRRKIVQVLTTEISRSIRYNRIFSIILIDIDDFKATNDTFGHNVGDTLLKEIADNIHATVRDTDFTGRWGGEEFLVICPETDVNGAMSLAEKIRSVIESNAFINAVTKTASFGVTTYLDDKDINSLIKRADDALYTAKKNGKNRVEKWESN
jgi:diguanylate cyclase (GGDEF)-like protein